MFFKEEKAQGAIEYLLILGAAILLAAVVITVIVNTSSSAKKDLNENQQTYKEQAEKAKEDFNL